MTLEKILRGAVLAGIFAIPFIPLIVTQSMFFPFITGKNFTFRIIVEIITALWLALALVNPEYRPRRSWVLYALTAFVLLIGVSDMLGANPAKSLWSNYERMEGWVTLVHLLALFVVTTSALSNEKMWRRLWYTSIGVSVLIGFYGIFQLMGWIVINQGGLRLDATFGNAIYLGIYMLFHLFLTALMWANTWREGNHHWATSVGFGCIMALQAFILFFTASRGAMLGVIGGAFLSALLLVILASQSRYAWRASVGVVTGIIALSGLFFLVKDAAFMQRITPLQRLASISLTETTIASRFMNAGMAIEGIKERPLFGWGQENYNIIFNKHYNPNMFGQEQWFDRTHNIIFDWLVAGGLIGLIAYALIYVATLWSLWRSGAFTVTERSLLTGVLAAYMFTILFVFDNITSYLMFILVIGYISVRAGENSGYPRILPRAALPRNAIAVCAGCAVLLSAGTVWAVNWKPIQANLALIAALQPKSAEQGGLDATIEAFKHAIAYDSFGNQEIREQLAQGVAGAGGSSLGAEEKQSLYTLASDEMKKQFESAPQDARFPFFLAILAQSFGYADEAQKYYEKALELSPNKQPIQFQLASNLLQRGNVNRAIEVLKAAHEAAPQFDEPRIMYASVLVSTSQDALAEEIIKPLLEKGTAADQRLIGAYLQRKRFDKIAELWASKVRIAPTDQQARMALAASYFSAGDRQKAIETLEQAAKDMPVIAEQVQTLIQQIKDGTAKVTQ